MGQKQKADSRPFPTVSVFSYGQINPTVKIPRLGCTQFVVPHLKDYLNKIIYFPKHFSDYKLLTQSLTIFKLQVK